MRLELEEGFGIMIYQEQDSTAFRIYARGADFLRIAMGKKIKEEMDTQRKTFVKGS